MNLDWKKFRKEKMMIEFLEMCDEYDRLNDSEEGLDLKAEILKDFDQIKDKNATLESLFEAAKVTKITEDLFRRSGIDPSYDQVLRQGAMLLNMIHNKETTIKHLMSEMTVH
jgi:molecular chaperone GrpE (heat shock protein)